MADNCAICFASVGFGEGWRWPCFHLVHVQCVAQSRTSLLSLRGPCFVCRQPAAANALEDFQIAFPSSVATALQQHPAEPQGIAYQPPLTPLITPLCCPRLIPGARDGEFVPLACDRRMRYMGRIGGSMSWMCFTCHRQHQMEEDPWHNNVCPQHGMMAYVIDGDHRYFSCCDWEHDESDVPMPINHIIALEESQVEDSGGEDEEAAAGENSVQTEADVMQQMLDSYENVEEEIALESVLMGYEP